MNIQNFQVPSPSALDPIEVPPGSTKITIGLVSRSTGANGGQPTFIFALQNFVATVTETETNSDGSSGTQDAQLLSNMQVAPGLAAGGESVATITGAITDLTDNATITVNVEKNANDGPISADVTVDFS